MDRVMEISSLEEMCDLMCGFIEEDYDYCDENCEVIEEQQNKRSKDINNE